MLNQKEQIFKSFYKEKFKNCSHHVIITVTQGKRPCFKFRNALKILLHPITTTTIISDWISALYILQHAYILLTASQLLSILVLP